MIKKLFLSNKIFYKRYFSFNHTNCVFLFVVIFQILIPIKSFSETALNVQKGLKALKEGKLEESESYLQKSRFEEPDNYIVNYDLGIVSYRKRDYANSIRFFSRASELTDDLNRKFDSYYNLGNAAFKSYDFALAVDGYKKALEIKKDDFKADYNLKVAMKKLEEMKERQKREQEQQNNKNQNEQKNNKDNKENLDNNHQNEDKQNINSQNDEQQKNNEQNKDESNKSNEQKKQNDEQLKQENKQNSNSENKEDNNKSNNDSENNTKKENELDKKSNSENKENKDNLENKNNKSEQNENKDNQRNKEQSVPEEDRRNVEMSKDNGKVSRPEASQKARAMKNIKFNNKEVEAVLKKMEENERENQQYLRIDNLEDKDPAFMDQEELQKLFEQRGRIRNKIINNEQDW